jgi:hypothetical protein
MVASFDSSRAVRFDLREGTIFLADHEPQLLLPLEEVLALAAGARSLRALARGVGRRAMLRTAARLAGLDATARGGGAETAQPPPMDLLRSASLPDVVEQLGGELALLGLGNLRAETWGAALIIVLDPCSLDGRGDELVEGIVEGALGVATDQELSALVVDRQAGVVRVVVGQGGTIAQVRPLVASGAVFTDVVRALHGEPAT